MRPSGNIARSVTGSVSSKPTRPARQKHWRGASGETPQIERAVPPGLVIYCDGACEPNPGVGGWGFVVYQDCKEIHVDCGGADPATNQTMELTAAIRAMEWASVHIYGTDVIPDRFRLMSDSQYVVKGCNEWRHSWKAKGWRRGKPNGKGRGGEVANLDLWKELDLLLDGAPQAGSFRSFCKKIGLSRSTAERRVDGAFKVVAAAILKNAQSLQGPNWSRVMPMMPNSRIDLGKMTWVTSWMAEGAKPRVMLEMFVNAA